MALTKSKIEDAAEELGWYTCFEAQGHEKLVTFSRYSEAGEDLEFTEHYDKLDEIPSLMRNCYQDFDVEGHVYGWLSAKQRGVGGIPDVVTLVHDAEDIEKMLLALSNKLLDIRNGVEAAK